MAMMSSSNPISWLLSSILEWKYYIPDISITVSEQNAQALPPWKEEKSGSGFKIQSFTITL